MNGYLETICAFCPPHYAQKGTQGGLHSSTHPIQSEEALADRLESS